MAFTASYSGETAAFPSTAKIFRATSGGTVFAEIPYNATAFDLFSDSAVVDDAIYFSLGANQKLLSGIKFNIGTTLAGTLTLVWEYVQWTSTTMAKAWTAIEDLSDDTVGFTVTGSNSVKFPHQWKPADLAVNGSTMLWVRVRISALTSITEGGANQTDVLKHGDGRLAVSGTTDLAPGSFTDIYNWLRANKPYISVTKSDENVFDFRKVGLVLNSRVKTTNEVILLGQNVLGNYGQSYNYFDYIESGIKTGTRGYDGSIIILYGTHNTSVFNFGANSKFYGSIIKAGKTGGDAHLYPGYVATSGEMIDSVMEIAPQVFAGTYQNVKISGYFILLGELSSVLDGLTYICSARSFMYKYGSNLGFTIKGLDWSFIPTTGVMIYLYSYGARTNEEFNFINPVKPLPVFGDAIVPVYNTLDAVENLLAMKVYDDSAGTYTDYTTAASNATADDVPLGGDVGDILYFGSTKYTYSFNLYLVRTGAVNDYEYVWEYYASNDQWVALAPYYYDATNNLSDTGYFLSCTSKGVGSGTGLNAKLVTVDGVNAYWIRARITKKGTGSPTATQVRYRYITGIGGWKMYQKYSLDALVTDTNGDAISGATVKVTYPSGTVAFTETTDASGLIDQQYLINVQYNQDASQVSTYWIKETITTTATLEVSKAGYESYTAIIDITRKQDMTIALKRSRIAIDQEARI